MKLRTPALLALLLLSSPALADPIQWSSSQGGNGHYYELVQAPLLWDQARQAAVSRT